MQLKQTKKNIIFKTPFAKTKNVRYCLTHFRTPERNRRRFFSPEKIIENQIIRPY